MLTFEYMKTEYQRTTNEALKHWHSSEKGLSPDSIPALQQQYGKNELQAPKLKSRLTIFIQQFKDVMILILMGAAAISFIAGETTDGYVILVIILGNALIGYFQEYNAEKALRKLQQMTAQTTVVVRNNQHIPIDAAELVPGDIVVLEAGNIIPADGRLLTVSALKTEEATLTGESASVEKITAPIQEDKILPADQRNMAFKSTIVSNGSGTMLVTATGMATEIGRIATLLETQPEKTPLQKRLQTFSRQLVVIVLLLCIAFFGYGLYRNEPSLTLFLTALSLAVAALPEALPAVITIALAQGASRMVKHNALIRKLPAVETLGAITYICSDKTGTLTLNRMTVEKVVPAEGKDDLLLHALLLNNEVRFNANNALLGDSTEVALARYSLQHGLTRDEAITKHPISDILPFDSNRMRMATLHPYDNRFILLVKGAPVKIAETLSPLYSDTKEALLQQNRTWAREGLRVLFYAYTILDTKPETLTEALESNLDFLGMAGLIDPPREEVIDAITQCKTAGIKPVMITGDQPLTALAIAERLQIIAPGDGTALTGADIMELTEVQLREKVKSVSVYARVSPEQKLKIVRALQQEGQLVAMTGDGVNDAPSLQQANIGVAMGITGSDVAKEAAHMILLDDNFATIVKAIKEGRHIYDTIKKFILYVLSCNLGELLVIFFAPLLGLAVPLLPIHILWINLVTDGLPGIALTAEPTEINIMQKPPRSPKENLFAGGLLPRILLTGILMAIAAFVLQYIAVSKGYPVLQQQTMIFSLLCFIQLGNALSVRSLDKSVLSVSLFRNPLLLGVIVVTIGLQFLLVYVPILHPIFKTTALPMEALQNTVLVAVACFICIEISKWITVRLRG